MSDLTIKRGQVWRPSKKNNRPRHVIWIGSDRFHGDAVRWCNTVTDTSANESSIMGLGSFVAWIRKHGATNDV